MSTCHNHGSVTITSLTPSFQSRKYVSPPPPPFPETLSVKMKGSEPILRREKNYRTWDLSLSSTLK